MVRKFVDSKLEISREHGSRPPRNRNQCRFPSQPTKASVFSETSGHLQPFFFFFRLTLTKWSLCLNLTRPEPQRCHTIKHHYSTGNVDMIRNSRVETQIFNVSVVCRNVQCQRFLLLTGLKYFTVEVSVMGRPIRPGSKLVQNQQDNQFFVSIGDFASDRAGIMCGTQRFDS